jgi:hypothetical protein
MPLSCRVRKKELGLQKRGGRGATTAVQCYCVLLLHVLLLHFAGRKRMSADSEFTGIAGR